MTPPPSAPIPTTISPLVQKEGASPVLKKDAANEGLRYKRGIKKQSNDTPPLCLAMGIEQLKELLELDLLLGRKKDFRRRLQKAVDELTYLCNQMDSSPKQ